VAAAGGHYDCRSCGRTFPVLFGIPDFRLRSDRYLDLAAERRKAARLAEEAARRSFRGLLDFYYEITDDVPAELASRYKAGVLSGPRHSEAVAVDVARSLAAKADALVLDAGCGAGGMLVALAAQGLRVVGVDIALRWLVICKKRLEELGVTAPLICADLTQAPFRPEAFDALTAIDVVEHMTEVSAGLGAFRALVKPGASVWITAANRCTLGPHPSTRIWAIGWMPAALRSRILRRIRGVDSLRFSHLLSLRQLSMVAKSAGLVVADRKPRRIAAPDEHYPAFERALMRCYALLTRLGFVRHLLLLIGPSFELVLRRPRDAET